MFQTFHDIVEPSRGGVRGGHNQFSWESVKMDKDRENYLGHSVKAPVGRSSGGPNFLWYTKDRNTKPTDTPTDSVKDERKKIIEAEREAMMKALGPTYSYIAKNTVTPQQTPVTPSSMKKYEPHRKHSDKHENYKSAARRGAHHRDSKAAGKSTKYSESKESNHKSRESHRKRTHESSRSSRKESSKQSRH